MVKRRTRRRTQVRRSRKQRGGSLTEEAERRKSMETAALRTLMDRMRHGHSLEKKQNMNEIAKLTLHLQILPYNAELREMMIAKFQEFLDRGMGNDPEYAENLIAAIAYLQSF